MADNSIDVQLGSDALVIAGENVPLENHSTVVIRRHPGNHAKAIGWITVDPAAAFPGMGSKLPHYGKYSYLAFEGDELGFAISYIAARGALVAMWAHARSVVPEARALANRFIGYFLVGIALWGASLLVPTPARWWLWALAIVVEAIVTATPTVKASFDSSTHGDRAVIQGDAVHYVHEREVWSAPWDDPTSASGPQ